MMSRSEERPRCRVCLCGAGAAGDAQESKLMSLFERLDSSFDQNSPSIPEHIRYTEYTVAEHIMSLAAVCLAPQNGLPDRICPACLLELRAALDFRTKCEASERALRASAAPKLESTDVKKEEADEFLEELSDCQPEDDKLLLPQFSPNIAAKCAVLCHDCGCAFKSKCKLRVHWKREHKQNTFTCPTCKRVFKSMAAFRKHIRSTQLQNCNVVRTNKDIRVEGEGKNRIFYCKQCNYKTVKIEYLRTHLVIHTPGLKPFKCRECPKSYTQLGALLRHKRTSHDVIKIPCHVCGKLIRERAELKSHLKTHEAPKFKCSICNALLKSRQSFRCHMRRHSGQKEFTCELCAATFFTRAELCNHTRVIHHKVKKCFKCHNCDYQSSRKEMVLRHEAKHAEGLQHPCTSCGRFYGVLQQLNKHVLRNHQNCPYKCSICLKMFARKDAAAKHIRVKHPFDSVKLLVRGVPQNLPQSWTRVSSEDKLADLSLKVQKKAITT